MWNTNYRLIYICESVERKTEIKEDNETFSCGTIFGNVPTEGNDNLVKLLPFLKER